MSGPLEAAQRVLAFLEARREYLSRISTTTPDAGPSTVSLYNRETQRFEETTLLAEDLAMLAGFAEAMLSEADLTVADEKAMLAGMGAGYCHDGTCGTCGACSLREAGG